ncbi:MAG: hypothetical protein GY859_18735 [Desulfobacterales bacterium]|nr:hypothetical protein [Desulfobacterales bacterium]
MTKLSLVDSLHLTLDKSEISRRAADLRSVYFKAKPEMCIERPRLITQFCKDNNLFGKDRISILEKARMYRHVLENRTPVVRHEHIYESRGAGKKMRRTAFEDTSPFAGSTTSRFKGVPLYPEFLATSLWSELWTISTREKNPYQLDEEDAETLNKEIFPHWMDENILEKTRARCEKDGQDPIGATLMQLLVFFMATKANCISHTIPDFSRVLKLGLANIIQEAREKRDHSAEPDQKEFHQAVIEVLKGVVAYSRNLSTRAEEMALEEKDPDKKKELLDIAEIHAHVPNLPARTYRDGLTSIWVCWTAIHIENPNVGLSLGRLDQILYDLYANDINDRITVEEALELTCYFWLKIGDHVPMMPEAGEQLFGGTGSNQAITIGGVKADDREKPTDAVNDLTYIMLKATELMKLRDPNLNARYHAGAHQPEYLENLCKTNLETGATPAIHNDKAVIEALTSQGDSLAWARDYGAVGCVEPVSNGRAYTASADILVNLPSILELTLYNGSHRHTGLNRLISKKTGDPSRFQTFEEFKKAFQEQLEWMADITTTFNNQLGETHQRFYSTPILSSLFEGPMDKGKDLIEGGARINASGVSIVGLADVADSLNAIEKVIFQDQKANFPALFNALNADFEENAVLHERLKTSPKYGDESVLSRANVEWLVKTIHDCFQERKPYRGGRHRVGYWSMTNHAGFGRLTGALPSGRKRGENFASGVTPVSGAAPMLTPILNSVAALPAGCVTNGMAFNIKYTPEQDKDGKDAILKNFKASVEAFCGEPGETGGMEIQFNIMDHQTFEKAVEHPEDYKELLVRVSGYTAYFVDLNPRMQKEVIDRTEYAISEDSWPMQKFDPFPLPPEESGVDLAWLDRIPGVGFLADNLLETLLHGMDFSFWLSRGYRRNIKDYKGRLLFITHDKKVAASAEFDDGDMKVNKNPVLTDAYDARICFKNVTALLGFLFSKDQDILNVILKNDVEIQGNVTHIYKFGYLAKDLQHRILGRA